MRSHVGLCGFLLAIAAASILIAACVDEPLAPGPSLARLVVVWNPLACEQVRRIVIELEDDTGVQHAGSAPCRLGGLAVDVPHHGVYRGWFHLEPFDAPSRPSLPIAVVIDRPIVHWHVAYLP